MREIEQRYPNIAFAIRKAPLWIKHRLNICDVDSPIRQPDESYLRYKIRMNIHQRIERMKVRQNVAYTTAMVDPDAIKGIPYNKTKHGILEHKIEKHVKRERRANKEV